MLFCMNNFHRQNQTCVLTLSRDESAAFPRPTQPISGDDAMSCRHRDASQLKARGQTGQEFVRRASGKASALAALLLPSTTQWGQREGAPWPADAWRQTHRRRITEFAGTALLPEPSSQTYGWPDRGYAVSKTASKAMIRKISLWLVRWEGQRRMFVVSRVVSTDYMCGLDLSGFWQKLWPEMRLLTLGSLTLKTGLTTVT